MMKFIKNHIYQWNISGVPQQGKWTGNFDTYPGFQNNLIMQNEMGVLWSISPQHIIKEIKQESE